MSLLTVSDRISFTKPPRGKQLWFGADVAVRKQDEIVLPSTMGNTTSETVLGSMTIPPLALTNRGAARAAFHGTVLNATSTGTTTIRTKLIMSGSTVTLSESSAISVSTSTNPRRWATEIVLLGSTLSTELQSVNYLTLTSPSTMVTSPSTYDGYGDSLIVVPNSTATATVQVSLQLSVASTGFSGSLQSAYLETLA